MKVVLLETIDKVGSFGAEVEVSNGYARNYLIPKKLAMLSTPQSQRILQAERKNKILKASKIKAEAEELAQRLEKISCTITKQAGENDKLFGSVTDMDIVEALVAENIQLDKKSIQLESPLKSLGIYTVPVKLHPEITANLKVWVVKA